MGVRILRRGGRLLRLGMVLFILLVASIFDAAAQDVGHSVLLVHGLGLGTVALDGAWQFRTGDDAAWSSPAYEDSTWEQIDIARPWGGQKLRQGDAQVHRYYSGFAWYRRHLRFASSIAPTADGLGSDSGDVAIFVPETSCIYEVYWNGVPISGQVRMPASPIDQFSPAQVFRLGPVKDGVLAIRVWTVPLDSSSAGDDKGLAATPRLGNLEALNNLKAVEDNASLKIVQLRFVQLLVYGAVAILGLLAWFRNRGQKVLKWTVLFFVASMLSVMSNPQIFPWLYDSPILFFSPGYTLEDIALWYLLIYLLGLDGRASLLRWARSLAIVAMLSAFADNFIFVVGWSSLHVKAFQFLDAIFTIGFSGVEVFPLVLVYLALRKRLGPARWLVAMAALFSVMYDVVQHSASQGQRFTRWTLGETMLQPLFSVNGFAVTIPSLLSSLLVYGIIYAVYRFTMEQGQQQVAMQQEYKSAQELQRLLIPESQPRLAGYAVTSAYRPAAEVGGDFFQVIPAREDCALLVIGDVSGKGLAAAMTVSMIVGALRTLVQISDDPAEILASLNRGVHGQLADGFVTCLVLRLGPDGDCTLAHAGHTAPFLNELEVAIDGSLPLGIVPNAVYDSVALPLAIGDRMTLYTDGLLEARDPSGEVYGFDRLTALLANRPDASHAIEAAVDFGQQDDITVLTLTRLAIGEESTTLLIAPKLISAGA